MYEPTMAFSCDDISPNVKVAKLKELLRTTDRFDINATLFVIPKSEEKWNLSSSLVQTLKDGESCCHEIGIHGLTHFPFETGYFFDPLNLSYSSVKNRLVKAHRILLDKLDTNSVGFRAPYHHYGQSLWKALNDLDFLYDSSHMALQSLILSYFPPLRAAWFSRRRGLADTKMFHPMNLKLWEIPITQEFTWYNLKFEASRFHAFLQNNMRQIEAGFTVINSHLETLSEGGLQILRELFLFVREKGLTNLTLRQIAEKHTYLKTTGAYV